MGEESSSLQVVGKMKLDSVPKCLAIKDGFREPVVRKRILMPCPAHGSILGLSSMSVGLLEEPLILSAAQH